MYNSYCNLVRISPEGTFMKANNFKFVNPTTKKSILDFDSTEEISVIGDFGDQMLRANAIKTPRVGFGIQAFAELLQDRLYFVLKELNSTRTKFRENSYSLRTFNKTKKFYGI